jgi:hypothetical protein
MDVKIGDVVELTAGETWMTVERCQIVEGQGEVVRSVDCAALGADLTAEQQGVVCTIWHTDLGQLQSQCFPEETLKSASTTRPRHPPRSDRVGY